MGTYVFIWILCAIVVFICLGIYKLSQRFIVGPLLKDADPTLNTALPAFREAHTYDSLIDKDIRGVANSISKVYEEMCILHPLEHEGDPRVEDVVARYKDLLKGKILDPDGKHIPTETLDGRLNPDYKRYLRSQVRAMTRAGMDPAWFKEELKRFSKIDKFEDIGADFYIALEKMGAPEYFTTALCAQGRMEKYIPEEWKELIAQVKKYEASYHPADVIYFLESVSDKDDLLDEAKMDAFTKLRELGIDDKLAAAYIHYDISEEDLEDIVTVMEDESVSCEEALKSVLERKKAELKTDLLKETYRQKVAS